MIKTSFALLLSLTALPAEAATMQAVFTGVVTVVSDTGPSRVFDFDAQTLVGQGFIVSVTYDPGLGDLLQIGGYRARNSTASQSPILTSHLQIGSFARRLSGVGGFVATSVSPTETLYQMEAELRVKFPNFAGIAENLGGGFYDFVSPGPGAFDRPIGPLTGETFTNAWSFEERGPQGVQVRSASIGVAVRGFTLTRLDAQVPLPGSAWGLIAGLGLLAALGQGRRRA